MGTIDLLTPGEMCSEIGSRCRALRLARNLSQAELADMTGSSLSAIRRLEARGHGTLMLLAQVAQALQVAQQFETFLLMPVVHIADLERVAAGSGRRRASRGRAPPT
jgi:transcriptional regulator with XRE-family HTH domain